MKYEYDEELPAYCGAVGGVMFACAVGMALVAVVALVAWVW